MRETTSGADTISPLNFRARQGCVQGKHLVSTVAKNDGVKM